MSKSAKLLIAAYFAIGAFLTWQRSRGVTQSNSAVWTAYAKTFFLWPYYLIKLA